MTPSLSGEETLCRECLSLLGKPGSVSQGLTMAAEVIVRQLGVDFCGVYLLRRRQDELVLRGKYPDTDVPDRIPVGTGITGRAAVLGVPIQVAQLPLDPRACLRSGTGHAYQSIIAVPITRGDEVLGAFNLQTDAERVYSATETEMLQQLVARFFGRVVEACQERDTLRQRTAEVQALNELGQAMNSGLDLDESLELIASRTVESLQVKGAAIRLVVADGSLALATVFAEGDSHLDMEYERRIAEFVAGTGEPIAIDDPLPNWDPGGGGSSLVCVPLLLQDRVVGTLTLAGKMTVEEGRARRLFSDDDLDVLFAISSQIAAEIEDIRLTARLQELVLAEQQQAGQLRALLESISEGLLALDQRGRVVEINSVARRILELGDRPAEGLAIDQLIEDKPPISQWLLRGEQFANRVISVHKPSGKSAAMANLQPVSRPGRETSGAVITFREMDEVGRLVKRVLGAQRTFTFDSIIGASPVLEKTKELARVAAGTASNILIHGETGTGKEVFAQAIHNASAFSDGPFLPVNCAALPRDLIESELFGYVEGAFTGAVKKGRLGRFELASGGTLFLDEIGEVPLDVQVKLLRVIQDKTVTRVGGDRAIPVDCRLIAATNRDLRVAVAEGSFRQDLLYRLDVIPVEIPPVRDRHGDLRLLMQEFLSVHAERNRKIVSGIDPVILDRLTTYSWPGNVREVENAVEHAVALAGGQIIGWQDLPEALRRTVDGIGEPVLECESPDAGAEDALAQARKVYEASSRRLYLEALRAGGGEVSEAAGLLRISRATLYRRLRQHDLTGVAARMRSGSRK